MRTEAQTKYSREYMRAYRKRTNHASDKLYRQNHHEECLKRGRDWKAKNKDKVRDNNATRIRFKNKQINIGSNPRTGICSKCGKSVKKGEVGRTHMHHLKYDKSNPKAHTVELCEVCHRLTHNGGEYSMKPSAILMRNYRAKIKASRHSNREVDKP